jgi:hypothetical protein
MHYIRSAKRVTQYNPDMRSIFVLFYVSFITPFLPAQSRIPVNFTELGLMKDDVEKNVFQSFYSLHGIHTRGDIMRQPSRVLYHDWNGHEKTWQKKRRDLYAYNPDQEKIYSIAQNWNGSAWIDQYRANFVYTEDHQVRLFQYESWDGHDWHLYVRFTYDYDVHGNLISFLVEDWVNEIWINRYRKLFDHAYDLLSTTITRQDWWQGAWYNRQQEIYQYNASYHCQEEVFQEWNGTEWTLTTRNKLVYSPQSLLEQKIQQEAEGDVWKDVKVVSYGYNPSGNCISETVTILEPSPWDRNVSWTFRYDDEDLLVERLFWCEDDTLLHLRSRDLYTYDGYQRITSVITQDYTGPYSNQEYVEYSYAMDTPATTSDISELLSISPNPVSSTLQISYPNITGNCDITIWSLDGREIFSHAVDNLTDVVIPVHFLSKGMYVVKTQSREGTGSKTFVKL